MISSNEDINAVDNALFAAQTAMVQLANSCWQNGNDIPSGTVDQQWIDETRTQLKEMQRWLNECESANESFQSITTAG